jgi:hypothetical protein
LPVVGLLLAAGEQSRLVRVAFLAIAGAALLWRPKTNVTVIRPARSGWLFALICLFQLVQSVSWLVVYVTKPAGMEITRLPLIVFSIFPWLAIWTCYANYAPTPKIFGLFPSSIGVILWGCTSVVLSMLNFSSDSTAMIYGGVVEGAVLSSSRIALPGFPGIVSGGVFCGLGILCCIGALHGKKLGWSAGWFLLPVALLANGVRVTDTRSATALSLLFFVIGALSRAYSTTPGTSAAIRMARTTRLLIWGSVIAPFVAPLLFPALEKIDLNAELVGLTSQLLRTTTESVFSLSGRSEMWAVATETILKDGLTIGSFHPLGEFGSGVSDVIYLVSSMPGTGESAHSHNGVLNYYFSFGLIGLGFLIAFVNRLVRVVLAKSENGNCEALQFPFAGFMMFFAFESLLSPQYLYFGLYFTLLALDIYTQSRRLDS